MEADPRGLREATGKGDPLPACDPAREGRRARGGQGERLEAT
ncbi:UNVERIFIED_CONTAM: hypothetical protein GTU68_011169 [Idotea baltica]|nr:hypothetical protein [Idotea baltica]